jgi:hypothetical protein
VHQQPNRKQLARTWTHPFYMRCASPKPSRPTMGSTQPPIQWVRVFFSGVKWPGPAADHSSPAITQVKKCYVCAPSVSLHGMDRGKLAVHIPLEIKILFVYPLCECVHRPLRRRCVPTLSTSLTYGYLLMSQIYIVEVLILFSCLKII